MKRLVYIANVRLPTERAHGIQVMKMLEAFSLSGVEAELLVPKRMNHIKADPFEYYNVKRIFKIVKLPCLNLIYFYPSHFSLLLQTLTFLISAKLYLLFRRYDILYTREQLTGIFFKNFVLELHSWPKRVTKIHKKIWRRAKALVVLTGFIRQNLVATYIKGEKILVAPDGVDLTQFSAIETKESSRESLNLTQDKKIVLYAGHLYDWKGVHVLAQAAQKIKDTTTIFIGGNPDHVQDFSKLYEGTKEILILGPKLHQDVPVFMRSADVLVLPNSAGKDISRLYTSPMKLFEYMASDRPVVASDLPSIREILDDSTAYFFEPDNPADLARAIEYVLTHKEEAEKKSEKSFNKVKEYTWEKRAQKILGFIK